MLDFLSSISDSIGTALSFIGNFLSSLLSFFIHATRGIDSLLVLTSYLPDFLILVSTLAILVVFILHILGR